MNKEGEMQEKVGRAFRWQCESDTSERRVGRKEDSVKKSQTATHSKKKKSASIMESLGAKVAHKSFPTSHRNWHKLVHPRFFLTG